MSVINGTTVVGQVSLGAEPESATYDSSDGYVYVTNLQTTNVSVINGISAVGSIVLYGAPYYAGYDPANQYVYVVDDTDNLTMISGTSVVESIPLGFGPTNVAYDASNGYVYIPDEGSGYVSVVGPFSYSLLGEFTGASWWVYALNALIIAAVVLSTVVYVRRRRSRSRGPTL